MAEDLAFNGVRLSGQPAETLWDLKCSNGHISTIQKHLNGVADERLVTPSLCHPHIHLDKCFLLQHPKYADLQIKKGHFAEAMELTSKCRFLSMGF
jgi:cytosine/adenosine deaminase-related metal-dependent hydrolase